MRRRGPSPTIDSRASSPRARTARSVSIATSGRFSRESRPTHTSRTSFAIAVHVCRTLASAGIEDLEVDTEWNHGDVRRSDVREPSRRVRAEIERLGLDRILSIEADAEAPAATAPFALTG